MVKMISFLTILFCGEAFAGKVVISALVDIGEKDKQEFQIASNMLSGMGGCWILPSPSLVRKSSKPLKSLKSLRQESLKAGVTHVIYMTKQRIVSSKFPPQISHRVQLVEIKTNKVILLGDYKYLREDIFDSIRYRAGVHIGAAVKDWQKHYKKPRMRLIKIPQLYAENI